MNARTLSPMNRTPSTASDTPPATAPIANTPAMRTTIVTMTSMAPDAMRAATLATGTSTATPSPVIMSSPA
jgi:hypothetical protein